MIVPKSYKNLEQDLVVIVRTDPEAAVKYVRDAIDEAYRRGFQHAVARFAQIIGKEDA